MLEWKMYGETYNITKKSIWNQSSWLDVMIRAYLECALWSTSDNNNFDEPFDFKHDIDNFDDNAIKQAFITCKAFSDEFHDSILSLHQQCKYDQSKAGHDLWLTQNGHGAGFWDRGLCETGQKMTEFAAQLSECYIFENNGVLSIEH